MNPKQYFKTNQKQILSLLNTEGGRFMLGVDKRPIVKITPNSVHQLVGFEKDRVVLEAKMYTRDCFASLILPINKVDILDFEYKGKYDREKALHVFQSLVNLNIN